MNQIKYLVLIIWLLASCKGFKKVKQFEKELTTNFKKVDLVAVPTDSLKIYYSGCSGFYFEYGQNAILHDPFLSNNGPLLKLNTKKLIVNEPLITNYFEKLFNSKRDSLGKIKGLIASHSHYDHILDFPKIINNHLDLDSAIIGGNNGLNTILNLYKTENADFGPFSFQNFEEIASNFTYLNKWYYVKNKSIRILPIISDHAPHYYGIKFYEGNIDSTKKLPARAPQYKNGQSLSYLIDFLKHDQTVFRVYIQGSASQFPLGFPPQNIDNKTVDLAIICVASYQYVHGYPEAILTRLQPKHVILSHWENFFLPRNNLYQIPAAVPFTNVKKFIKNYKKTAQNLKIVDFTMPVSDTFIAFRF